MAIMMEDSFKNVLTVEDSSNKLILKKPPLRVILNINPLWISLMMEDILKNVLNIEDCF